MKVTYRGVERGPMSQNVLERAVEALEVSAEAIAAIEKRFPDLWPQPSDLLMQLRALAADLRRYTVVEGCAAPAGDPARNRWHFFGAEPMDYEDERPAMLLVERAPEEKKL